MIRHDATAAANYWMDSPVFGNKRTPSGPFDFGDDATVGLHLKRSLYDSGKYQPDDTFGIYLGKHKDGYVVAIKKLDYSGFSGCEVFDSLGDLQAEWGLD